MRTAEGTTSDSLVYVFDCCNDSGQVAHAEVKQTATKLVHMKQIGPRVGISFKRETPTPGQNRDSRSVGDADSTPMLLKKVVKNKDVQVNDC